MNSALSLRKQLAGVATYDKRMQDALKPLGVRVIAPEEATRMRQQPIHPHRLLATTRQPSSRNLNSPGSRGAIVKSCG
jgi:hypothetical protein